MARWWYHLEMGRTMEKEQVWDGHEFGINHVEF